MESRQRLGDMVCGNVKDDKKDKEGGRKIRHIFLSQGYVNYLSFRVGEC